MMKTRYPLVVVCIWSVIITLRFVSGHDDDSSAVTFRLLEEQPAGTPVGDLARSVQQLYRLEKQKLQFELNVDDRGYDGFDVDADSGLLATTRSIDREQVCPLTTSHGRDDLCAIRLHVRVTSASGNTIADLDVRVVVDDINDHDPTFASPTAELSLPETAMSGTLSPLPTATDLDAGLNGRLSYKLVPPSHVFDLLSMSDDVFLRLKTSIDRETQPVYSLTLIAVDSAVAGRRTGSLSITVVVTDVNDHSPTFNATRYQFTTVENQPSGSVIGRVQATDADEGDNARVMYAVTRINGDAAVSDWPLTVDAVSGDVVVVGQLDYELCSQYVLTVAASDCAVPPLRQFGFTHVVVDIVDVNDNPPRVTLVGGGSVVEVPEDVPVGTTLVELLVSDADSGQAGLIDSCQVSDHDQPTSFTVRRSCSSIDLCQYTVVTASTLDRESRDLYSLLVTCVDAGSPPLTGHTRLRVRLQDVNDNSPVFSDATPTSVELLEGNGVDDYVMTVQADDSDAGENASISYSLQCVDDVNNSVSVLHIDNVTGVVRLLVSLDRERCAVYDCAVMAVDSGDPSLSASSRLQLTVADADDQRAVFEQRSYEFHISENLPAGSLVGRVNAVDADLPPYNRFEYSLNSQPSVSSQTNCQLLSCSVEASS